MSPAHDRLVSESLAGIRRESGTAGLESDSLESDDVESNDVESNDKARAASRRMVMREP